MTKPPKLDKNQQALAAAIAEAIATARKDIEATGRALGLSPEAGEAAVQYVQIKGALRTHSEPNK